MKHEFSEKETKLETVPRKFVFDCARTHTGYNETKTRFSSSSSSVHGISYQGTETDQSYLIPMTMVMNKTGW